MRRLRRWIRSQAVSALPSTEPPLACAYADFAAWNGQPAAARARVDAQFRLQGEVAQASGDDGWPGWCGLCQAAVHFQLPSAAAGAAANLREEMVCPCCRLTARNRGAMALVCEGQALDSARIYLTEQASPAFVWLQRRCPGLEGSEFGLDDEKRQRLQGWFESLGGTGTLVERDVTRLDFADGSLDTIGSFDVLEHVPDYTAALREFSRCLRPGGRLVLTAPFVESAATTRVRARLRDDGGIEHLLEPEIHGDPVAGGVLCFYHFGWDLLDATRAAGFRRAQWIRTWSPREGLFGLWTLLASR